MGVERGGESALGALGALGALAGTVLDKLAATYLMLFVPLTDLGIVQNPMSTTAARTAGRCSCPATGPRG